MLRKETVYTRTVAFGRPDDELDMRQLLPTWPSDGDFDLKDFMARTERYAVPPEAYGKAVASFYFRGSNAVASAFVREVVQARTVPVKLGAQFGVSTWLFRDDVYTTKHDLRPEDVMALALQDENKVKTKLARARSLMDQVAAMEEDRRVPIPDDVKIFVWQRDQGRCVRCGSNENLEFDHIIPFSMGGSDSARNLQLLCEPCNRMKGGSLV